ncbi:MULTISPECIES: LysR family transcriptional regulator [Paraburkholderia]|uniref:Transcriptional regulator, LysR family n=1 Tax=Paraburkholderia megapolitana TaxID=420953 RepID=A0A1I3I9D6_9BURK|nr:MULTISPECIES: LysR family transcriptional regulator [Paraburkholderia]MCX4165656.1 LysR family transcriptional regulator [Paraburkholderia megapolitana]MDN7161147.1 LysR family transcriptional regulator [Paraburkholderia sp. CHISQ3]MDQ6498194.1 LysR family transcriptional regulator [Paraburkholderia megapolitana]QDQ85325.1 LysR family transcriptional regulator [Paraburkholderia megapolitana]SFI44437.1 transcriptional regulator, LysR family [Paraburkholderia megapolitana]
MDNLGDIRLFVEAAQLGGLSAAGRKLGLTPAAASARLAKLEAQLKARLFERTTRQLRLTDEGRLYLSCCQQALQALDDAEAALQAGQNVVRGKVRISATSDFGRNLLMHWLDEFNELYPEVTFALTLSDSLSNLVQEDIDLAIRFGVPRDSSLVARPLAPNPRVLCASPEYVARHGEPKDPLDLARFDCIVLVTASGPVNEWRFTRGDEVQHYTVPLDTSRETNDGAIAREWALRGYGIVIKSMWDVEADLRADGLRVLLPEWHYPDAPLHALYHRNRFMAPRVRVLLDFLSERFAQVTTELEALLGVPASKPAR